MSQTMSKSKTRWGGIRRGETERARHWRPIVGEWATSGLSQAEFCRQRDINVVNFRWWKRRLSADQTPIRRSSRCSKKTPRGSVNSFVEVKMADGVLSTGYEVILSGGRVIRFGHAFDAEAVSRLITAVEAAC